MATYFLFETMTREADMSVGDAPERAKGVVAAAAGYGVDILEWFYTVGPVDFVMKVEAPDDESVAAFVMALRRSGNVKATSLRAYTPDEWGELVARLT
ncbi:MAG: GYD domain-containing protein [bacterium]|nr:GYD domain-containing protein [bacterium]